jgi:DNA-binding XRE family transcriptional regulator
MRIVLSSVPNSPLISWEERLPLSLRSLAFETTTDPTPAEDGDRTFPTSSSYSSGTQAASGSCLPKATTGGLLRPPTADDTMVGGGMLAFDCLFIACRCEGGTHPKLAPMQDIRTRFGARIRQLRNDRGWSQEELADKAGLHRTYIGSVERGEQNLSLVNIERLAVTLSVSLAELFAPFGDKPAPPS